MKRRVIPGIVVPFVIALAAGLAAGRVVVDLGLTGVAILVLVAIFAGFGPRGPRGEKGDTGVPGRDGRDAR